MFGNKAQMQNMLKKARKMQEDLQKKQEELKKQTVDVSVGGGAVSLTMNGEKQIVALKIAKDAIDPEDPEILEDLITTAVNEAGKKADEMVQKSMSEVTGGLGLPAQLGEQMIPQPVAAELLADINAHLGHAPVAPARVHPAQGCPARNDAACQQNQTAFPDV